ncbi:Ig-like domain-containing protein [Paenibacillus sp. J2TS4]|uniref:Ig-like domain-containing protein n=1 Tax=Paenibacillus sp. J2TS4 TaxID=2807194 RepID=UPI001B284FDF|nr:Ig-like domain-containing protein [Paenibacillus sp. J2TS4]GIP32498.1 hypothetical protein J2TS4_17080 [Paenibacillus sp. J2TS4]
MRISRNNGATFTEYYESTEFPQNGNMAQLIDGRLYYTIVGSRIDENSVEAFSWVSADSGVTWTKQTGTIYTPEDTFTRGNAGLSTLVFCGKPIVESDGTMYNSLQAQYRFVNVSTSISSTRNFSKAMIGSNIDQIASSNSTESVHVIVLDQDGRMIPKADYTVTYSSDNTSVVTVNADGLLTPVGTGSAIITAAITYQGVTHPVSRQVKVIDDSIITELAYKLVKSNLVPNEQTRLIAWANNGLGEEVTDGVSFTYGSSAPSIATVSTNGTITGGNTFGKATISVTASNNGITFNSQVDVTIVMDVIDPITFEGTGLPTSFTVISGAASIATMNQNNVLSISDNLSTSAGNVELVGTQTATKVFEMKVYPKVLDRGFGLLLWSLNSMKEVVYQISVSANGVVNYFTDTTHPLAPAGTIATNNWYKFRVEANGLGDTKLFINNLFIGNIPKRSEWLETVDRVSFIVGSTAGTKDVIYVDDVSFFEPKPDDF